MKLKMLAPWKKRYDLPRHNIKEQRHYIDNKWLTCQSNAFSNSHVLMWELGYKESWVPKNWCFWTVLEKALENPLDCKDIKSVNPKKISPEHTLKDWHWSWSSNTLATWLEELTHFKRPWCWERLKARREGVNRRWDGWMASPTQCTWVLAISRSWWWTGTGNPGVLFYHEAWC